MNRTIGSRLRALEQATAGDELVNAEDELFRCMPHTTNRQVRIILAGVLNTSGLSLPVRAEPGDTNEIID